MNSLCVMCSSCHKLLDLQSFTKNQLKKKREPRCKSCVQTEVLGKIKGQSKSWEVLRVPAGAADSWPQASFRPKTAVFSMHNQDPTQHADRNIRVIVSKGDPSHNHQMHQPTTTMPQQQQHMPAHTQMNKRDPAMAEDWDTPGYRGKQGRVWATLVESPSPEMNMYESSRSGAYMPHTNINVPVSISVDHSRNRIYQFPSDSAGASDIAPPDAGMMINSPKRANSYDTAGHYIAQTNTDAGAPHPTSVPPVVVNMGANSPCDGMSSTIRPIIAEVPPTSVQYAASTAQIVAITPTDTEGAGETGDPKASNVQFLEWHDGSKYYGSVVQGQRHGKGIFVWPDGTRYDGHWLDNEMHGSGTLVLLSDQQWGANTWKWYNGEFQHGKYHGEGIFTWPDGAIYEGSWKQSRPHGYGSYESTVGGKYVGEWRYGTQYGTGTCLYANGIMYTGEFKNNFRHGLGTCQWPNGTSYSGLWDNNEMRNPASMSIDPTPMGDHPTNSITAGSTETTEADVPSWDAVNQSMETAELLRAYLRRSFKKK